MAKMTLIEIVQSILSDMTSDEVNSISDTTESRQVAEIVKTTFADQFSDRALPEKQGLIQLTALGDTSKPTYMLIPDNVMFIKWIKYNYLENGLADYRKVQYLEPEEFVERSTLNSASDSVANIVDTSGVSLTIFTNQNPRYWTTFDDKTIIFDAYNSATESTLQSSKVQSWGQKSVDFVMSDTFVPPIDENLFPLLLSESKSTCWVSLRGFANPKEEKKSRTNLTRSQKFLWRASQKEGRYNSNIDYGRKPV